MQRRAQEPAGFREDGRPTPRKEDPVNPPAACRTSTRSEAASPHERTGRRDQGGTAEPCTGCRHHAGYRKYQEHDGAGENKLLASGPSPPSRYIQCEHRRVRAAPDERSSVASLSPLTRAHVLRAQGRPSHQRLAAVRQRGGRASDVRTHRRGWCNTTPGPRPTAC